jgi:hypothetical protein
MIQTNSSWNVATKELVLQTEYLEAVEMLMKYSLILVRNGWNVDPNDFKEDLSEISITRKTREDIALHESMGGATSSESMVVDLATVRPGEFTPKKKSTKRNLDEGEPEEAAAKQPRQGKKKKTTGTAASNLTTRAITRSRGAAPIRPAESEASDQ